MMYTYLRMNRIARGRRRLNEVVLVIKISRIRRDVNTRPPDLPLEKPNCQEATVRTRHGTTDWF